MESLRLTLGMAGVTLVTLILLTTQLYVDSKVFDRLMTAETGAATNLSANVRV